MMRYEIRAVETPYILRAFNAWMGMGLPMSSSHQQDRDALTDAGYCIDAPDAMHAGFARTTHPAFVVPEFPVVYRV